MMTIGSTISRARGSRPRFPIWMYLKLPWLAMSRIVTTWAPSVSSACGNFSYFRACHNNFCVPITGITTLQSARSGVAAHRAGSNSQTAGERASMGLCRFVKNGTCQKCDSLGEIGDRNGRFLQVSVEQTRGVLCNSEHGRCGL